MYKNERIKAFELFLAGQTLRQIAKDLGVSRSSVERWSSADQWRYERQKVWYEKTKIIKEEVKCEFLEASTIAWNLFRQAAKESEAYLNGEIPKKARKFNTKDLLRLSLASLYMGSVDIHRVDRAHAELKDLQSATSGI